MRIVSLFVSLPSPPLLCLPLHGRLGPTSFVARQPSLGERLPPCYILQHVSGSTQKGKFVGQ